MEGLQRRTISLTSFPEVISNQLRVNVLLGTYFFPTSGKLGRDHSALPTKFQ